MIFEGSGVALVTPINENNEINFLEFKNLIEFQIASGTNAIIILGTTGESATVTRSEREKIIKFTVMVVDKRVPVIVGAGSNSTEKAISLVSQAKRLGADCALVVTPYYNKCNQEGLFRHYSLIADKTKFPIIIYNVPKRTGVNILPETVLKLAKNKYIVGIKEASGDIAQIAKIIRFSHKNFYVYSGDDLLALPLMSIGAKGVISVTANVYPTQVQMMCYYAKKQDFYSAKIIFDELYDINVGLFLDVNPICVKYYMNLCGFNVGKVRLPLTEPSADIKRKLEQIRRKYERL